jgi:hypothetical protein
MTKTDELMLVVEGYVNVWVPSRRAALRDAITQALEAARRQGYSDGIQVEHAQPEPASELLTDEQINSRFQVCQFNSATCSSTDAVLKAQKEKTWVR